jgi:hypothetical protein
MMGAARHGEQQVSTGIHARRDPAANLEILARTRVRGSVVVNQRQDHPGSAGAAARLANCPGSQKLTPPSSVRAPPSDRG